MTELADVQYRVEGPVAWITLDRPDARNAYSEAMVEGLVGAIDRAEMDEQVRAVVLSGAGSAFCAGGDLKRMRDQTGMFAGGPDALRRQYQQGIQSIPRRLSAFDKPVIAAVNGPAMGAGLDLACMCDIRVAAKAARFGSSFIQLGLVPGDGGAYFLTRIIGFPRALELMLSGRTIGSDEALALGLVHEVVEEERLLEAAADRATALAAQPPVALRLIKRAAYHALGADLDGALELAATFQGIAQTTEDHREAIAAILEKRSPQWKGR